MIYVVMIVCVAGMFYANLQYKTKGVVWGRPAAGVLGLITVGIAVSQVVSVVTAPNRQQEMIVRADMRYLSAGMEYLGDYLATNFDGHRILLIDRPATEKTQYRRDLMMQAFKKGLDGKLTIMATESPKPPVEALLKGSDRGENLEFNAKSFDLLVKLHPECNLVVSLIGLPGDLQDMKFWAIKPEQRPKLVVTFANLLLLKPLIKEGYINAVMTYNSKYRPQIGEIVPENVKDAFNKRFVLIIQDNIDQFAADNPNIFSKEIADSEEEEEEEE